MGELAPLRTLAAWPTLAVLLAVALGLALAYQRTERQRVDVGGVPLLDYPFVAGMWEAETSTTERVPFDYRWTEARSFVSLPGLGRTDYALVLTLSPGPNPAPRVELRAPSSPLAPLPLLPGARDYHTLLPAAAAADGDIELELAVEPFANPGDGRELGVAFGDVAAEALGRRPVLPPPADWLLLVAATGLAMLVAARAGAGQRGIVATGVLLGGAFSIAVALERLFVAPERATLPAVLLGTWLLLLVVDIPLRRMWRTQGWDGGATPLRLVLAAAFAVYLAGMLHPQLQMFDIAFHVNRFNDVWRGGNYFLTVGSSEWGGGRTFYPPLTYLALGPLALLTGDAAAAVVVAMALLLAARLLLVYVLVRHGTGSARAGLWAGIILAVLPVTVLPHQWGIVSNLLGETLTLAVVTLVLLGWRRLRHPAWFAALTALLALALTSHPGALVLCAALLLLLIGRWWSLPEGRTLGLAFVVAAVLSVGMYHWKTATSMLPQAWAIVERQLGGTSGDQTSNPPGITCRSDTGDAPLKVQVGGSVSDGRLGLNQRCVHSWGEVAVGGTLGLLAEARAYFHLLPLLAVPFALAWLRRGTAGPAGVERQRRLGSAIAAWLLVAAVFAVIGVVANLYVRYPLFAAPAVAAALAIVLDRVAANRWGSYAAAGALLLLTGAGLAEWYARILVTNH